MSALEIPITPNRFKNAKRTEARQPTEVVLAPFSEKAVVTFEEIPVTKTARRLLSIYNPCDDEIKVMVTKTFKPELNTTLEWTSKIIPAKSEEQLEIIWNPLKEVSSKETLQLTDSRNFRKDISVIMKSIKKPLKRSMKRFPTVGATLRPVKTLKLKTPSPVKRASLQRMMKRAKSPKVGKSFASVSNVSPLLEKNHFTFEQSSDINVTRTLNLDKENQSPLSPGNASSLFDKIQFTPATVTLTKSNRAPKDNNNLDYLASLPTPILRADSSTSHDTRNLHPRRLAINMSPDDAELNVLGQNMATPTNRQDTPRRRASPRIAIQTATPPSSEKKQSEFDPHIYSTVTKTKSPEANETDIRRKLFEKQAQVNNNTFDLDSASSDSFQELLSGENEQPMILDKTETLTSAASSRPLSMIEEEDQPIDYNLQQTFEVPKIPDESLIRDIKLVGTPLRKYSESMKDLSAKRDRKTPCIQGSMPNLNEMEALDSIEQNRYFYQQDELEELDISLTSSKSFCSTAQPLDVAFNQNEILAHSSRYNLHELENKTLTKSSPGSRRCYTQKTPSRKISTPGKMQKRARENSVGSPNSTSNVLVSSLETHQAYTISMTVSPPKRTKIDFKRPGTVIHATKWSHVQPKKFNVARNLSLVRKPSTPRKPKSEDDTPRKLYDSDLFLQPYINPDPFAATTTCDPFMASTMYLDEKSVDRHETQFKKWLNALVTIPADLDADCNQKIDVGRVFNEVRNKDLTLAPTKEEQSMNYLTRSRMDALRAAAVRLFMSDEMRVPCSQVAVHINKTSIKIRNDRDLHLDVVMQRYILELLLCFNPLWLRIGLEVVFGETIYLHSNADVVGLSTFILNRLFRDKFLEQKYSRAFILSQEYSEKIKKFTLQKFLFLLLFLDKAKNNKIIKHNPCLFVKNSEYKETKDILLRFSSELLANIGDVTKNLRRLGYVLTHKQSFLDEFNYAFTNIAVDLRDGIRLTRVMEIILLRDDLTKQLRAPAISRLQRIFNVNLALKALAEADFVLTGDITAADIVDGHREKTLSLLWQIIYKFRAPKFNTAAAVIQKWWHNKWLMVVIRRRIKYKLEMIRINAATTIQTYWRAYKARQFAENFKTQRVTASICLQKYFRRYLAQRRFLRVCRSTVYIQRWYRATVIYREIRTKYVHFRKTIVFIQRWYRRIVLAKKLEKVAPIIRDAQTIAKIRHEKAIIIQRCLKSYTVRRRLRSTVEGIVRFHRKKKLTFRSASKIQSFFQQIILRREFLAKRESSIKIQQFWRNYRMSKAVRAEYLLKKSATLVIQQRYRAFVQRKTVQSHFILLRHSTIIIQRRFRAQILMRKQVTEYRRTKSATVEIQQWYRSYLQMRTEKSKYLALRTSTIKIQQKLRATFLARTVRMQFVSLQYYSTIIQQQFRANRLMRAQRSEFLQLKISALIFQRRFRANQLMKSERQKFLSQRHSCIVIQQRFRAYVAMRIQKAKFTGIRRAVVCIQQRFRAYLDMHELRTEFLTKKCAALTIQQRFRAWRLMKFDRARYLKKCLAAVILQKRFRAFKAKEIQRSEFIKLKKATIILQQKIRATIVRNSERAKYLQLRNSAIVIQKRFRAHLEMRSTKMEYEKLVRATKCIQQRYRAQISMRRCREEFQSQQNAAVAIQRWVRAVTLGRSQREGYLRIQQAVIVFQRRYRAQVAMKLAKLNYQTTLRSVIVFQRRFRAQKAMKLQRTEYKKLCNAAIKIQGKFRALQETRKVQHDFVVLKKSTVIIQRYYRAYKVMRTVSTEYLEFRTSVVTIQRFFKSYILMKRERKEFLVMKQATITIQQWFRASREMKIQRCSYVATIRSVRVIQQHIRATIAMRIERRSYVELRQKVIRLQQRFRGYLLMREELRKFQLMRRSAIVIQQRYRAHRQMLTVRNQYLLIQLLVVCIQRRFRANLAMRIERRNFLELKAAAIFVQQRYRSKLQAQLDREHFLGARHLVLGLQTQSRGYLARQRFEAVMTPEMREHIRRNKAAKVIQRFWRGYAIRKRRIAQGAKLRELRRKIKQLKDTAKPYNTLKYKLVASINFLKGTFQITEAIHVLIRLENMSRVTPHLLVDHVKFVCTFCYGIMAQAIRSEADKPIIEYCSRIILNMARYQSTYKGVFQEQGLVTIAQMLLRWCDKDCGIFSTLCTLVWVFAHCPNKKQIIRDFMTTNEAIFMVRETKKLVLRKDKMLQNVRNPTKSTYQQSLLRKSLPCLKPDFGVVRNKPYVFICPVFGFDTVLSKLEIELV